MCSKILLYSDVELTACFAVDGFWLPWSDWSDCTVSCGNGSRTRMRECFPSKHGGANCSGLTLEEQECNTHYCPGKDLFLSNIHYFIQLTDAISASSAANS